MARANGQRLPVSTRRQAVQTLQGLLAAGVSDTEAREQIAERYDVSPRTSREWLAQAYAGLAEVPKVPVFAPNPHQYSSVPARSPGERPI